MQKLPRHQDGPLYVEISLSNSDHDVSTKVLKKKALVDTGCTLVTIPESLAKELSLNEYEPPEPVTVELANGEKLKPKIYEGLVITYQGEPTVTNAYAMGNEILFGLSLMSVFELVIYPKARQVTPIETFLKRQNF